MIVMSYTRRDLALLSAGLIATAQAQRSLLQGRAYRFEDLTVKGNPDHPTRAVLDGLTHTGFRVHVHETELAPGSAPHPPHHHDHEEMIMIREGTLEVTIAGNATQLGPGSVAFVASNLEQGWRNVGSTRAHYFVVELGRAEA